MRLMEREIIRQELEAIQRECEKSQGCESCMSCLDHANKALGVLYTVQDRRHWTNSASARNGSKGGRKK